MPANPAAVTLNLTVVSSADFFLTAWPFNQARPLASTLNYVPGQTVANGAIIPLCTPSCAFEFSVFASGVHLIVDVVGYFRAPAGGFVSSVTAGAGLTGGTINSSGAIAVDTAVIQSRVTGTCAAGSSIRSIAANGSVVCESDDVGTGTVTSVGSGTGLIGGPITTSGTLSVDTSVIQARVTGTCVVGSFIRAIASNGTVTCGSELVQTLYAVVNFDGTLARGLGVTSVSRVGATASYEVIFNRNVTTCVFVATVGPAGAGSSLGEVNVASRSGNVNGVFVDTNNSDGSTADKPFHLLVNC